MAKIKYLNLFDITKLKNFVNHLSEDKFYNQIAIYLSYPFILLNSGLPISLKFRPDIYTICQDDSMKGILSIQARRNNPYKWRIKKLLLAENSSEYGEQLINYVVAKYGALGVETIEVDINSEDKDMIDLFSKACGFRYCLDYQYYLIKTAYYKNRNINSENCIYRPFKPSDASAVADLYNQNISQFYKFPLSKVPKEFEETLFTGLNKKTLIKFILEDKFSKQIRGYVQIETENNYDFVIEVVLLPSYEYYFEDMITFSIIQISKKLSNFNLYLKNNRFHVNSEEFEKILKEIDNEATKTNMIFVKDFYRKIKDNEKISTPAIIYNEIKGKPVYKM